MMIAERQNRESIPKRRKKEKIIKVVAKDESNNDYDEDDDEDKDEDDSDYVDNVKEVVAETNEALSVYHASLHLIDTVFELFSFSHPFKRSAKKR